MQEIKLTNKKPILGDGKYPSTDVIQAPCKGYSEQMNNCKNLFFQNQLN